jgi:hypothetical protein
MLMCKEEVFISSKCHKLFLIPKQIFIQRPN